MTTVSLNEKDLLTEGTSKKKNENAAVLGNSGIFAGIRDRLELTFEYDKSKTDDIFVNVWSDNSKRSRILHLSIRPSKKTFTLNFKASNGVWANEAMGTLTLPEDKSEIRITLQLVNHQSLLSKQPTHIKVSSPIFTIPREFIHNTDESTSWMYPTYHVSMFELFSIENVTSNESFSYKIIKHD